MLRSAMITAVALVASPALGGPHHDDLVSRVVFGSCFRQDDPAPIWAAIGAADPDLLIMLGDNVYADTTDMDEMRADYAKLGAVPEFARLLGSGRVLATWDDHDYGENDAGREYPMREASKEVFLDFFGEPEGTERRTTPGIYDAVTFGPEGRRVQVILLDTRYFRTELVRGYERGPEGSGLWGRYLPQTAPGSTMLGDEQWDWLEDRLREPADLRILCSSIQLVSEDHAWEAWATMPRERERMLRLIRKTGAEGVVVISGDRHRADLSRYDHRLAERGEGVRLDYPLYDLTSSSLNAS
ncbi:MAG: alkaline phosphatase D family protein, partial [Planctomycetota bacterium]